MIDDLTLRIQEREEHGILRRALKEWQTFLRARHLLLSKIDREEIGSWLSISFDQRASSHVKWPDSFLLLFFSSSTLGRGSVARQNSWPSASAG